VSNVSIEIAGRKFAVACDAGEEEHIAMLGRAIDGKIAGMPHIANQSEARALLFAALLLADENHELKNGGAKPGKAAADVAGPLETLAERLERLAGQLENAGA